MNKVVTFALPKGRLAKQVLALMTDKGYEIDIDPSSRVLVQEDTVNNFRYMFVKPSDVITYVKEGVCDIGFVGNDTILEEGQDIYELYDLNIGKCKMVIAGPNPSILDSTAQLVVATKYPKVARQYLEQEQIKANIVTLHGSVELGPLVGLSDVIVDIYETGNTLKANNLYVIKDLFNISTRLIANKASFRIKRQSIESLIQTLEQGDKNA